MRRDAASNRTGVRVLSDLARSGVKVALCQPVVPCGTTAAKVLATDRAAVLTADGPAVLTAVGFARP